MNIDFNKILKVILPFAYIVLAAFVINSILFFFLPKSGVEFTEKGSSSIDYKKYDGFYVTTKIQEKKKESKPKEKKEIESLSNYTLKAIYSTSSNAGWINVESKRNNKSYILSQYEKLDSYLLTKLYKNYVVFEKAGKEYKLSLKEESQRVSYEIKNTSNKKLNETLKVEGDSVVVKRNYLNSYVNNIEKVWNNISIKEIRKNGKIDGFKVFKVKKDSVFDKLGLKRGDIIKSVNNNVLSSYADAFKVYNNISSTKYLNIEILRNNEIMELNYEIE